MNQAGKKIKDLEVMVAETIHEARDAVTLVLFTGNDQLTYAPGHFLTIEPQQFLALKRWVAYFEDIKGKKERPRAYSLSSSPDEKYLAITVKEERYISGVTPYPPLLSPILAKRTEPGTRMVITGFTGPYTLTDTIRSQSEEIVHICAGSGIVPTYSIIKHDLRVGSELKHILVYSNKRLEDVIFLKQLDELQKEFPKRLEIIHTLTRETDESLFNTRLLKGRITADLLKQVIRKPAQTTVFTCGPDHTPYEKKAAKEKGETLPPSFLGSVLSYLEELGIPKNKIKKESYG